MVLSTKSWKLEEVLIPAALVWVLASLGLLAIWSPGTTASLPSLSTLWVTALVIQLPIVLLVHRFLRRHGTGWTLAFGFSQRTQPRLWIWVIGSVVGCAVVLTGVSLGIQELAKLSGWKAGLQSTVLALQNGSAGVKATIAFSAIFLAPVVEEPLFRGILYQSCRDAGYRRSGWVLTSLIFGVVHGNLPSLLPLTLFGAYQCWLYERTGNLLACILTHAGFNAVFVGLILAGLTAE